MVFSALNTVCCLGTDNACTNPYGHSAELPSHLSHKSKSYTPLEDSQHALVVVGEQL